MSSSQSSIPSNNSHSNSSKFRPLNSNEISVIKVAVRKGKLNYNLIHWSH